MEDKVIVVQEVFTKENAIWILEFYSNKNYDYTGGSGRIHRSLVDKAHAYLEKLPFDYDEVK